MAMLRFAPVPLDAGDPRRRRLGALLYLGGWELSSDSPRFGGISALHVEGGEAIALSDAGTLFRFALPAGRGRGAGPHRAAAGAGPARRRASPTATPNRW